eukprot:TRINITY_DN5883_c0_g1_i1.p1 TRINITY_DN5883_c0_g1~~TRINITY_DN5883_c0_g1_i1.p1  ORF type:complete len:143 (-),score=22.38 TRINITY_DN5883_c0_g1_i1:110-538(-)
MSGQPITPYEMTDQKPAPPSYDKTFPNAPPSMETKPVESTWQPPPPAQIVTQPQPQVVTQVQYVAAPSYGPFPATVTCRQCQASITTRTSSELSNMGWIVGGVLCIIGCWPCCLIPCCMDSMQAVTHTCPSCNTHLGRYNPS